MDRKNGGLSSKCAVLIPVSKSSVVFEKVLAPLQNAYLFEESKEAFRYPSAFLFNNSTLQEKYEAFRANRRQAGYSEEELKEGYGFLLFDDINKAAELGETGVLTGNSTCKTLGDPSKGVYIARFSDCLAPDHWHRGKSGFIVIIRLTKGKSNKVKENYTQNCISPSVGFDCHESKELPMVSANTSSFLGYERTQYYLYEVLPGECTNTNPAPSHVCPFAIVPFSYDDADAKATMSCSQEQSGTEGNVLNDFMWRGQLHINSQIFHVRLKSRSGSLMRVKLPPVVKVDQAVSMVTLRQFAPKAVFETRFSGEVCLDGISCSVHEFVPVEVEDPSLSLVIRQLKDKDLGLTVHLNESGFLILLHSSNFAACTGNGSSVTEALQAMFLFPGPRALQKDTVGELEHSRISSDILRILPALDYAEIEMQKRSIGSSEDRRGQFVQHIKNYAALIQTGLAATPSKDVRPLSQDYDESVTSLFSNPKWTNRLWQWLRSYLTHPVSFQLPVYSVTELLAAGNRPPKEVFNEELAPLEQSPGTVCSDGPEELLSKSTACDVSSSWQKDVDKDSETNSVLNGPLSRNPTAELVVSITSAEGTSKVMDDGLSGSDAVLATKQLSNTLMATTNTADKNPLENTTERKKLPRGRPKGKRKRFKWSSPPTDELLTSTPEKPDEEIHPAQGTLDNDSPEIEWTILSMSQCKGGKLTYKYKKVPRSQQLQEDEIKQTKHRRMENVRTTRSASCSLLNKTDRWDLRPILTGCGRTLVPHGSLNSLLQKNELESIDREQRFNETVSETSEEASQLEKMDEDPVAGRLAVNTTNNVNSGDKSHNTEVGPPRSETSSSPPELRDRSMVNIAEADSTGGEPSSTADDSSHLKDSNNSEHFFCKFKKIFARSKRKTTPLDLGDSVLPVDAQLSSEPSLKKSKTDMDGETLNTESNTDCQDSRGRNKEVLLAFAQALGLMPIEVPDKIKETEHMDTMAPRLPLSQEGQPIPPEVGPAQVIQTVPSPIQETPQVKRVLQKRKKKWEKRFHTSSSTTQESAKSNSFETNVKELFCSNGQSNALNLLADLALGNCNNQAQPQLDPLPMTKPDPRSDVDNLLNDGTKLHHQWALPSLLQQPADSPVLPSNPPPPEGILGSKDVIDLIAIEHDYSWSTASQVPKTSSPAGMPGHSQNLSGPELPALCNVSPEGPSEHKAAAQHMSKDAIRSRRFRRSRVFVEKDGVLQVTRKWKGNYDFDLDSKFTNHPVEKTVCRGLHGSWNTAGKDSGEEAQLLIHIWIGLFYSRSTPRFIHSSPPDLEDCLERSDGMVSSPTVPKTAPVAVGNSDTQDLEPIQEDRLILNQGAEILDLSIKKQGVNDGSDISEASEAFIREAGIQDEGPAQCQVKHKALQIYRSRPSEFDDDNDGKYDNIVKSTSKRTDARPLSATNLEHSAVNLLSGDQRWHSLCKVIANMIIQPQLIVETQASIDPESANIETSEMGERKENLQNAEVAVDPPIEMDACEITKGIVEDPNSRCTYLVGTEENDHDESKCEDHRNNADSRLPLIDNEDCTTGHQSTVPYVNLPENETQSTVRSITLPHGSDENRNEDEDCQSASDQCHFTKEEENHLKPKPVSDGRGTIKGDDPGGSGQSYPVRRSFEEDSKKEASTDDIHKIEIFREQEKSNNSTPLADGLVVERQAEVLPDVSVVSCDRQEQDDQLVGNEVETAYILSQKAASHHRAHSPQNGISKLLQDPREMPLVGKDDSKQVEAGPQVLPIQDKAVELVHEPKEMAVNIDVRRTSLENGEKVPTAENGLSVFEDHDSKHELGSEGPEVDERCPPPTKGDGPGGYFQLSLVGEPYDSTKYRSSDEMLWMQYENAMGGGDDDNDDDDDTISEENFNLTLDESIPEEHGDDSMDEDNSEIESQQSNSDNYSTPLHDGIEGESQAEVLPGGSVVSCDHQEQDDELVGNEVETAYILAQKAASHRGAHSPQNGVSKLLQDPGEMPLVGKDDSKQEVEAGPQVLPLQDNPVELVHEPKEMATNRTFVCRTLLENGEKVPIAGNALSVFEDRVSTHNLGSEDGEMDERFPTPTKWDGPVVYCQATLVRQPYEGDGIKDASSDEMSQTQCANVTTFMSGGDEDDQDNTDGYDTISEENLNLALDKTPEQHDNIDSMDEANIEIVSRQNKSDNDSTSLQDGIIGESQAEVLPDVSVVRCDHQEPDDEFVGNEVETACILAQKAASHHRAHSPQNGVSKLLQDPSEMPLVGKDESKQEVEGHPQIQPLQVETLEMAKEPNKMAMNINMYHMSLENGEKVQVDENILSVLNECNYEHNLGSETSEFDERCPTPTVDENPYEGYPSLELSISNEVCKISPEKEHRKTSTLAQWLGKEVDSEPDLKAVGDQVPGRDLCEDNQTLSYRLLETTDLPPSRHQSPTLCRESMDMDNLNDKTSLVNVGITPAKQSRVKRKRFSDVGSSLLVPCSPKKMSNDQEICEALVQSRLRDDSHLSRLRPVVVLKPLTGHEWTDSRAVDIYRVKEKDNSAISKPSDDNQTKIPVIPTTLTDTLLDNRRDVSNRTSKGDQHENEQEICSRAGRVSVHGVGEGVLNQTHSIDALHHVEERDHWKPSRTLPSNVSTQSDEVENLSSSSFQDPIQECPVEKQLGHSSSIHTDPSTSSFKYTNYRFTKTVSNSLGHLTETCMNSDLTQFSMEQEFLIFSEEMKQLLIGSKRGPGQNPNHRSMHSYPSSDGAQSVIDLSMDVDMLESGMEETTGEKSCHRETSSGGNSAEANVALSDIVAECGRSYHTMMDNVCAGKSSVTETDGELRECAGPIKQMRSGMFGLNHGLNLVVRQPSKTKFKFYILATSEDAFFKDTKAKLEAAGHTEDQPYHFLLSEQSSSSSLLLIILKNEDIAEHIIKVPHLLDLKKSANVLFAGIDHPKDIGNLTHQDIFKKGGFIMLEGTALEALSFCQMKALLDFLQELSRNGKWKWILHYRDIRRLKENSRFRDEEVEKKNLVKSCQETGIVEVLPYHECDQTCRPHPRYLKCLMQLQVQNITARFPVFVTDITNPTEDRSFERHGILTMNINTLLNVIETEKFSPSTSI